MRKISVAIHLGCKLHRRVETGAPKLCLIVKPRACKLRGRVKDCVGKPHGPENTARRNPTRPKALRL